MSNIDNTLAERGERYGAFTGHAEVTQSIKCAIGSGENWDTLPDDMKEAMEMVAHKFGRILNGDPYYVDSWTDCIGYLRLVEKRLIDNIDEPDTVAEKEEDIPTIHLVWNSKKQTFEKLRPRKTKLDKAIETMREAGFVVTI